MDGRAGHLFPRRGMSVSPREKKKESEIFLRLFLFDLFQTLIYRRNESVFGFMELSQEKNLSLLSQIMFKLQPDSNEMENHHK